MNSKKDGAQDKNLSVTKKAFELFQNEDIDISFEHVKNLMQFAPHVKELFTKGIELSDKSGQNVFELIKNAISIYEEELKRDDLSFEQRNTIYDRIDKQVENAMQQDDSNKKYIVGAIGAACTILAGGAIKYGPKLVKSIVKK